MKKQKSLKINQFKKSPNSNLMQKRNHNTEITNFQVVHYINVFQHGSNGNVTNMTSWFSLKSIFSLLSIKIAVNLLFDIDLEKSFLSGTFISLIIYLFLNYCKDALFTFFS